MEFNTCILVVWSVLATCTKVKASENLARNESTNQSSDFNSKWVSSTAVDGCTKQLINDDCCTHTATGKSEVWWQVDLQQQSVIETVNIIYRDETTLFRLAGFEIYLSNTSDWASGERCYQDNTTSLSSMSATQNVTCTGIARYVTIYNDRRVKDYDWYSNDAILELCEVYVNGCPIGRYGNGNCTKHCLNCLGNICNPTSGKCDSCDVGYYEVNDNCNQCPANCAGVSCNTTNGACLGCLPAFSGTFCRCPVNCKDDTCPIATGHCTDCEDGYYGPSCTQCPSGCSTDTCDEMTGDCSQCDPGFYDTHCNQYCRSDYCKYNVCDMVSGQCMDCIDGYYGRLCTPCPTGCSTNTCDKTSGNCFQCDAGFYGSHCNQSCIGNCNNRVCDKDNGKCTEGCSAGFSGDFCLCPFHCNDMNCLAGYCTDCKDGYYGPNCTYCPAGCSNDTCNKTSGNCFHCVDGLHGNFCTESCPDNCVKTCAIHDGQCTECTPGKHGGFCNQTCPDHCSNDVCEQMHGNCTECVDGFHGNFCTESCPDNCVKTCAILDGQCTECTPGKHGGFCNQTCPDHCSNDVCEQMHGNCTECDPGFHGRFCNQMCPTNCKNDICGKLDGECIETKSLTSEPDNQIAVFAGTGAGVVAVIAAVIVVIVVVVLRRRKKNTKHKTNTRFDDVSETTLFSEPSKQQLNSSHPVSKRSVPLVDDASDYINVCDVNKDEVIYSNTGTASGVSIEEIRAMIPKKMENEEEEFQKEFKMLPWGAIHPHQEATKPSNIPKNRFKTTFPYDHSRVILHNIGNDPDSTYINANYIDSVDACKVYVACQGPKEKTVDDFWRMIWQLNTGKIVMVTNLIEGGNVKCHQYWPNEGEPLVSKHFNITLDRERTYAFYVLREMSVRHKKIKAERQIHQFHFTAWPDHGTPNNLELVLFHRRITSHTTHLTGQMVVHCSAGLGRTGTFIGLDALSREAKKSGLVDITQYIRTMRKDRMNMVQTHEQYIALHELLVEATDLTDTLISSSQFPETLSNILPAGKPTNQTKLRKEFEVGEKKKKKKHWRTPTR